MGMMQKTVAQKLFELNGQFYREYGGAFAETRRRIQPGVHRILEEWLAEGDWLDLGCGSGALSANWVEQGKPGLYEGLDFSPVLIAAARRAGAGYALAPGQSVLFNEVNLADSNWKSVCSLKQYSGVLMFAALHHIPGAKTRLRLLGQIAALLPVGGLFIHSEWQFTHSPKLVARIQPWSAAGLTGQDVEEGDTLLDWRRVLPDQTNQPGLRYVHLFSASELETLASQSGFEIINEFQSDGSTGNLSLYQVWRRN